jgi:hypothetical protein
LCAGIHRPAGYYTPPKQQHFNTTYIMGIFSPDQKVPLGPPPSYRPPPSEFRPQNEYQGSSSNPHPRSQFASLLLSRTDRIRIVGFPNDVVGPVNEAVRRVWVAGIQQQGMVETGGWEWKLTGRPCQSGEMKEYLNQADTMFSLSPFTTILTLIAHPIWTINIQFMLFTPQSLIPAQ